MRMVQCGHNESSLFILKDREEWKQIKQCVC